MIVKPSLQWGQEAPISQLDLAYQRDKIHKNSTILSKWSKWLHTKGKV